MDQEGQPIRRVWRPEFMVELLNLGLTQPEVAQAGGGTRYCRMKVTNERK